MSRYCLDTSAYSQLRRGHGRVAEILDAAEWIGLPVVVAGELLTGFLLGSRFDRNRKELEEFVAAPVVNLIEIDLRTASLYAEIFAWVRKAGTPLPTNDIWIAACAARVGATVLTFDSDFRAIPRVGSLILEG